MKIMTMRATSRISTKINDTFYTFEYTEERLLEENDDIEVERAKLWDTCHSEVDTQVGEVIDIVKKRS